MYAYSFLTIIFIYYSFMADAEITKKHKSLGQFFNKVEKDVDVDELKWEEMTPDEKEIHATKNDNVYSVYERHRTPTATLAPDALRVRIMSKTDSRPSECTEDGRPGKRVLCPTSNQNSHWWSCLLPTEICDGVEHCQNGEDENAMFCMFYKATMVSIKSQTRHFEHKLDEFNKKLEKIGHLVMTQEEK